MTTVSIITLIFAILILIAGLSIAISKYCSLKKENNEKSILEFITIYSNNILNLLKDCYYVLMTDEITKGIKDEDILINNLVFYSIDVIREQFEDYGMDGEFIKLFNDEILINVLKTIIIKSKDQIIKVIGAEPKEDFKEKPLFDTIEENTSSNLEEPIFDEIEDSQETPEEITEVSKEEAKEMIDIGEEIMKSINDVSSKTDVDSIDI